MSSKTEYVMDSTALIAVVYQEPGYERVVEILDKSAISAVNLAEIINKLVLRGAPAEAVRDTLLKLELKVEDWSEAMAYRSAEFTRFNKSHGLSLGDRACISLALKTSLPAFTTEEAWERSNLGIKLVKIR